MCSRVWSSLSAEGDLFSLLLVALSLYSLHFLFVSSVCLILCCCKTFLSEILGSHGYEGEPGSSGSIMSHYGLNDQVIEVRSPAGAKDLFL
jgi:hypothetical protein